MSIRQNLETVRAEIESACIQSGRPANAAKLIAVSKTRPVSDVREAMDAGQIEFGENRVQELVEKQQALPNARWHMIGTLQRNKVRQIASFVHLIHSIDSEHLLSEVDRQAEKVGRTIDCLLQVNISHEEQKGGFTPEETEALVNRIGEFRHVRVLGLMGMAEFTDDIAVVRAQFRSLAQLRAQLKSYEGPQIRMDELSMGMSGDFEVAIEEGATMVRIGSSIFGHR